MCWQCDNPGRPQADYLTLLREEVADRGWIVQGVEESGLYPPWAYTIGLSGFGLPELVATGLPLWAASDLLNGMAEHSLHAAPPEPGERIPLRGGPLIEVVPLAEPSAHLIFAVALYGPEIRALQLVHADERGRWPWSADFRDGAGGQPVLGVRHA
ncbi:DUF4262 domain-containing protein [Amycolatopsis sp. NPDC051128]|uniref:DUF4262 domain-containing protein n=1 Tax=Amycolatopsis sp. NPDC051128 TaxID=3155412 RepID=UPI0034286307